LGLAGDEPHAQAIGEDLARKFPLDTILNRLHLPALRAELENRRGRPERAIETLATIFPYEFSSAIDGTVNFWPVYVRADVYLHSRQNRLAAAEFQKIIDHPGMVANSPVGALARLGLARAYSLAGEFARSRTAYQDFLTLWRDADARIPIMEEAKQEYARLQ
jgi:hypothetical protein